MSIVTMIPKHITGPKTVLIIILSIVLLNISENSAEIAIGGSNNFIPLTNEATKRDKIISMTVESCGFHSFCDKTLKQQTGTCGTATTTCECYCTSCEAYGTCCPDYVRKLDKESEKLDNTGGTTEYPNRENSTTSTSGGNATVETTSGRNLEATTGVNYTEGTSVQNYTEGTTAINYTPGTPALNYSEVTPVRNYTETTPALKPENSTRSTSNITKETAGHDLDLETSTSRMSDGTPSHNTSNTTLNMKNITTSMPEVNTTMSTTAAHLEETTPSGETTESNNQHTSDSTTLSFWAKIEEAIANKSVPLNESTSNDGSSTTARTTDTPPTSLPPYTVPPLLTYPTPPPKPPTLPPPFVPSTSPPPPPPSTPPSPTPSTSTPPTSTPASSTAPSNDSDTTDSKLANTSGNTMNMSQFIECKPYPLKFTNMDRPGGLQMVTKCPQDATPDQIIQCEFINDFSEIHATPVYGRTTDLVYRNIFCAKCHDELDVVKWSFDYTYMWDNSLIKRFGQQMNFTVVMQSEFSDVFFRYPEGTTMMKCDVDENIISDCNVTEKWETFYRETRDLCAEYRLPVTVSAKLETGSYEQRKYRNVFCALCNGEIFNATETQTNCQKSTPNPFTAIKLSPFTVSFTREHRDMRRMPLTERQTENSILCAFTHVYDHYSRKCRPLSCQPTHYVYNHTCLPGIAGARGIPYHMSLFYDISHIDTNEMSPKKIVQTFLEPGHGVLYNMNYVYKKESYTFYTLKANGNYYGIKLDLHMVADDVQQQTIVDELVMTKNQVWVDFETMEEIKHVNEAFFLSSEQLSKETIDYVNEYLKPGLDLPNKLNNTDDYITMNTLIHCIDLIVYDKAEFSLDHREKRARISLSDRAQRVLNQGDFVVNENGDLLACTDFTGYYKSDVDGFFHQIPLSGDSSDYFVMVSWTAEVCGLNYLCNPWLNISTGRCANTSGICAPCRCENCEQYGDCCPDYVYKNTDKFRMDRLPDAEVKCEDHPISFKNVPPPSRGIKMMAKCPASADSDIRENCENGTDKIPVFDRESGTTFRNEHCAKCHGKTQYEKWDFQISCLWNDTALKSLITSDNPLLDAEKKKSCDVIVYHSSQSNGNTRQCDKEDEIIKSCDATQNWKWTKIGTICPSYYHPITVHNVTYQNLYCAKCNGVNFLITDECVVENETVSRPVDASVLSATLRQIKLVRFPPYSNATYMHCIWNEIYDTKTNSCRPFYCEETQLLTNQKCEDMFTGPRGVPLKFLVAFEIPTSSNGQTNVASNMLKLRNTILSNVSTPAMWKMSITVLRESNSSKEVGFLATVYYMASDNTLSLADLIRQFASDLMSNTINFNTDFQPANVKLVDPARFLMGYDVADLQSSMITKDHQFMDVDEKLVATITEENFIDVDIRVVCDGQIIHIKPDDFAAYDFNPNERSPSQSVVESNKMWMKYVSDGANGYKVCVDYDGFHYTDDIIDTSTPTTPPTLSTSPATTETTSAPPTTETTSEPPTTPSQPSTSPTLSETKTTVVMTTGEAPSSAITVVHSMNIETTILWIIMTINAILG